MIVPNLEELVLLFHASVSALGQFREVAAADLDRPYRQLLAHEHHMTVAMEEFHGALVELEVLQERRNEATYAREILLRRTTDGRPVQYGIVRLHWQYLPAAARDSIERHAAPLGRILIEQQVLREVRLAHLWSVKPSLSI